MLTLTYAVIGYYVFGQVTSISGFGGITGVNPPAFFDTPPGPPLLRRARRCRWSPTSASARCAARRSGSTLEGIRDDSVRMSSLGFNVPLHRTLAFAPGRLRRRPRRRHQHLVERPDRSQLGEHRCHLRPVRSSPSSAGSATSKAPGSAPSCSSSPTTTCARCRSSIASGITEARFNTVVGVVVLIIVVASPNGLMGLITALRRDRLAQRADPGRPSPTPTCPQQPWRNPHETQDRETGGRGRLARRSSG